MSFEKNVIEGDEDLEEMDPQPLVVIARLVPLFFEGLFRALLIYFMWLRVEAAFFPVKWQWLRHLPEQPVNYYLHRAYIAVVVYFLCVIIMKMFGWMPWLLN